MDLNDMVVLLFCRCSDSLFLGEWREWFVISSMYVVCYVSSNNTRSFSWMRRSWCCHSNQMARNAESVPREERCLWWVCLLIVDGSAIYYRSRTWSRLFLCIQRYSTLINFICRNPNRKTGRRGGNGRCRRIPIPTIPFPCYGTGIGPPDCRWGRGTHFLDKTSHDHSLLLRNNWSYIVTTTSVTVSKVCNIAGWSIWACRRHTSDRQRVPFRGYAQFWSLMTSDVYRWQSFVIY